MSMSPYFRKVLIGICMLLLSSISGAFELIYIDYGRSFFFVFDGGSAKGVQEGMTACVDDENGWELFCGKVVRVKTTVAAVEAPDNLEAYFDDGLTIRVIELGAPKGHRRFDEDGKPIAGTDKEAPRIGPIARPSSWLFSYVATPVLPYHLTFPDFSIDGRMQGSGSIWQEGPIINRSLVGVKFGRRMPLTRHLDQEAALTWRYISPTQKDVDFDPNYPSIYASEKSKMNDLSLNWDALSPTDEEGFLPGWLAGVSGQYSTFAYTSSVVDESGGSQSGNLASSTASLMGVTARAGARIEHLWLRKPSKSSKLRRHSASVGFNLVGLLPLYAKTKWSHGTHTFPSDVAQKDQSQSQLEEIVSFKKSRFGAESSIYVNWVF